MAGRKKKYSDSLNPEMVRLYEAGMSLYAIGQELKVHPEIVKRRLMDAGIEIRCKSDAMKLYHAQKRKEK
jgi:hypothetical protein